MSWDAWIEIDTGAGETLSSESRNYTHNCNSMMRAALDAVGALAPLGERHLYALNGKPCIEIGPILQEALAWWEKQPAEFFKEMEPANGHGSAQSAFEFWSWIKIVCLKHPKGKLCLHG